MAQVGWCLAVALGALGLAAPSPALAATTRVYQVAFEITSTYTVENVFRGSADVKVNTRVDEQDPLAPLTPQPGTRDTGLLAKSVPFTLADEEYQGSGPLGELCVFTPVGLRGTLHFSVGAGQGGRLLVEWKTPDTVPAPTVSCKGSLPKSMGLSGVQPFQVVPRSFTLPASGGTQKLETTPELIPMGFFNLGSITVTPKTVPVGPRPKVTRVRQSHAAWRAGSGAATFAQAAAVPVGTTFSFDLDRSAGVRLSFDRQVPGRRVGRHCVAPGGRNRRRPACTRGIAAGRIGFSGHAGTNTVGFQGRLADTQTLTPGRYRLTILAAATGAASKPVTLSFRVIG